MKINSDSRVYPPAEYDYRQSLEYLYSLRLFGTKLGLKNIRRLLHYLGDPQRGLRFYHIAGTNGKGSTAVFLHALLGITRSSIGLFTSPHLEDFRERIRIGDRLISPAEVKEGVSLIRPLCARVTEAPGCSHPTYFEVVTALACWYFNKNRAGAVVWEVGLGGRLDATNAVTPRVALITSLSLDHQKYLGDGIEVIASEKGGVIKPGIPVVLSGAPAAAREVIRSICRRRRAELIEVENRYQARIKESGAKGQSVAIRGEDREYGDIFLPLAGRHQTDNFLTALAAWEAGEKKADAVAWNDIRRAVARVSWPGRFEKIDRPPGFILDGAHNPAGAEALARTLKEIYPLRPVILILGILADKDIEGICRRLLPVSAAVMTVRPPGRRGLGAADLAAACRRLSGKDMPVNAAKTLESAIERCYFEPDLLSVTGEGEGKAVICITGSLRLVGEARRILREHFPKHVRESGENEI